MRAAIGKFGRVSDLKAEAQFLRLFIQQQNRKNFVINNFADDFSDPAKGRVQVERCCQHVGDFEEKRLERKKVWFGND